MKLAHCVAIAWVPFAGLFGWGAAGCGGTSSPSSGSGTCPPDPACYVVQPSGECSLDPDSVCIGGSWECSARGTLGSGCLPDGGIAPPPPPPPDAGSCPLATLQPPLACTSDATCTPYGGHCEFSVPDGPGECACGAAVQDSGTGPDACVGAGCLVCTLPSFTVACSGSGDPTCAQYGTAFCAPLQQGFACACEAVDPPHNACPLDCSLSDCQPGAISAQCIVEPDGGFGCLCAFGGLGGS